MKKLFLLLAGILFMNVNLLANYVSFQPYQIEQPDGVKIDCFISGDEYYNWLHDKDGYTIIQANDGYYYYGELSGEQIVPTVYKVNSVNPGLAGLKKWAKISSHAYEEVRKKYTSGLTRGLKAPHTGTLNNIVVYIKFSDDTEFTNTRQFFDDKFNLVSGISLKSYYQEVSYNQFTISSTHYPDCAMTTNLSYTDSHPRSYFQPYNATTNPNGYNNDSERTTREHTLLKDALDWISINSPVPAALNVDGDNDGYVDNVCFNIRGGNGAWASLLWAHSWALYSYNVYINGKRVWEYTFQPETQLEVKTICHEMFHAIGAPDLYHYSYDGLHPVQNWDLMESGFGHMGAYMKWKYASQTWISSIPEITVSGTYTLNPLTSSTGNCYKIASPNSTTEFYVVEYRKASGTFEGNLPGSGLLVYRIDPSYGGNSNGPPDEVYIYRPDGTTTVNGNTSTAFYSLESGRTAINDATNPSGFLQNGSPGGISISNVTSAGSTISFTVGINTISTPSTFTATGISTSQINLQWNKNSSNDNVMLAWNTSPTFGNPVSGTVYAPGSSLAGGGTVLYTGSLTSFIHSGLAASTTYYYKIWSVTASNQYSYGVAQNGRTLCSVVALPYTQYFSSEVLPNCWSTQVSGLGTANSWTLAQTTNAGGTPFEMKSTYQSINQGVSRLVTAPLNTVGVNELNLSFRHMLDAYSTGTTLRVQSSSDGVTWTNESWFLATTSSNVGPSIVNTTITHNLNSASTYIAFTVEGDLYQYDYWYIDDVAITAAANKTLNIYVYLEGLFNGTNMNKSHNETGYQFPSNIADQISIELHSPVAPYQLVGGPFTANLTTDSLASVTIPVNHNGTYYIVVKHRNSIETWSATPVSFAGSVIYYNFCNAAAQAYGNNLKLMNGHFAIFSGDSNQDGLIDSSDLIAVDNDGITFETGYLSTDINGDGLIDSSDMIIIDNNAEAFVSKITP